jgi:hypothetical protein
LNSAIANAKQAGIAVEGLYIENVTVNKGIVLKRSMPRARGSASRINKRTSHVLLTLIEKTAEKKVKKEVVEEKTDKKEVKKIVAKSKKVKTLEPKN